MLVAPGDLAFRCWRVKQLSWGRVLEWPCSDHIFRVESQGVHLIKLEIVQRWLNLPLTIPARSTDGNNYRQLPPFQEGSSDYTEFFNRAGNATSRQTGHHPASRGSKLKLRMDSACTNPDIFLNNYNFRMFESPRLENTNNGTEE